MSVEAARSGVYLVLFDVRLVCIPFFLAFSLMRSDWLHHGEFWFSLRENARISASFPDSFDGTGGLQAGTLRQGPL